ncbi:AAA family ATPase [Vibrio sp. IB15]|uniref:AAA family ATPase n=1 Tax=Vibrio sp. IB15 TaxID=2779368 RepID=UPI0018E716E2|nr:AAA family ATPase [Vibrio sp. IB15]MBJ2147574.1 AAA family ATPase [Vibrio sp. IB15]
MNINKIELLGVDKPTAFLDFSKGLNVIVGPSNTGKSYVIQCLKYALGAKNKPKNIKQSKGYTDVKLTLENQGHLTIITRNLTDGKKVIIEEIDKEGISTTEELKIQHAKGFSNLSNYMLKKFELNDKLLLKGKEKLTKSSMSLRVLEQVLIMDEARIVGEHSPLGSGDKGDNTLEASFLRTLLTNLDDKEIETLIPKIKEFKENSAKINELQGIVDSVYSYETDVLISQKDELSQGLVSLEKKYSLINDMVTSHFTSSKTLIELREKVLKDIDLVSSQIREDKVLKSRFELLAKKYSSDKDRLIAISESTAQFQNYSYISCPTCEQSISEDKEIDTEKMLSVLDSTFAEINKIDSKIEELKSAVLDLEDNIISNEENLKELNIEIESIDSKTKNCISKFDISDFNKTHLEIIENQRELYSVEHKINEKSRITDQIQSLTLKNKDLDVKYSQPEYSDDQIAFSKIVETILNRWGFPDYKPTTYDKATRDLVIGGSPRMDFGKGYRALSCSAYIIGLMEIMAERHPQFVVLDSPITTFKEADREAGDEISPEDEVSEDVIFSFYSDLCDSYLDKQIIVFENKEPDTSLIKNMKYTKFTRNKNYGRYGFFQV